MTERIDLQPGWVLHQRPYRESSLLLEVFTRDYGRLGLVANGAKRPRSRWRACLQAFQPLSLSWSLRGELGRLRLAEPDGVSANLRGDALYAGFYVNELLLRLCLRGDPHPELFSRYVDLMQQLGRLKTPGMQLRLFERDLLEAIGYGLQLEVEADTGAPVEPGRRYRYDPGHGPRPLTEGSRETAAITGAALLALRDGRLEEEQLRLQAKRVLQSALEPLLENRPLRSVQMLRQLRSARLN